MNDSDLNHALLIIMDEIVKVKNMVQEQKSKIEYLEEKLNKYSIYMSWCMKQNKNLKYEFKI